MSIYQDTYYRDLFIQANVYINEKNLNQAKKLLKEITYARQIDEILKREAYMRLAFLELHFKGLINPNGAKKALEYVNCAITHGATEEYASPTILMSHLFAGEFKKAANFLLKIDSFLSLKVVEKSLINIFEEIASELRTPKINSFYINLNFLSVLKAIHQQFPTNDDLNFRIVEWSSEMRGDGALFAYKVGKRMIEHNPESYQAYVALTKTCCYGYLNRPIELIEFANIGIALLEKLQKEEKDPDTLFIYNGEISVLNANKINALMSMCQYEEAYTIAIKRIQSRMFLVEDLYNAALALYKLKRLEESLEIIRSAISYRENHYVYKLFGDILFSLQQFDRAANAYSRAVAFLKVQSEETFMNAYVSDKKETPETYYISLVQCYYQLKKYVKAYVFLEECKKIYGESRETILWSSILSNTTLQQLQNKELKESIKKTSREIKKELKYAEMQLSVFRYWSLELMKQQGIEIDDTFDFEEMLEKMDDIIVKMLAKDQETSKYKKLQETISMTYPKLSAKSLNFLATADYLLATNRDNYIDFAPIIVEYAKVVEEEFRLLFNQLKSPLGTYIRYIEEKKVQPFYTQLDTLKSILAHRNNCAHPGRSTVENAKTVRQLLINHLLPLFDDK